MMEFALINLPDAAGGFKFLAIVTGIGTFLMTLAVSFAVSDNEDYAGFLVVCDIILAIAFLISGFMGFSLR